MSLGYVKVGCFAPEIKVADTIFNCESILKAIDLAEKEKVKLLVLPALSLTGATAGELFNYKTLIKGAGESLLKIVNHTLAKNIVVFVGFPFSDNGYNYNAAAVISNGKILGIVPKSNLTVKEREYFAPAPKTTKTVMIFGNAVPFGKDIIFADKDNQALKVGVEIGEDLYAVSSPSVQYAGAGARIIVNLSAECEFSGERDRRIFAIKNQSEKLSVAYAFSNAGAGESTTDAVYSGQGIIVENGEILAENKPFDGKLRTAEIDLTALDFYKKNNLNGIETPDNVMQIATFALRATDEKPQRVYDKTPFIKSGEEELSLEIQAQGLAKRIKHTGAQTVVLGLSGGLDSTLALIVAVRAIKILGRDKKDILAVTMPCYGTSSRTFDNSVALAKAYKVTLKKIKIEKSVTRHLKDIGHDLITHDAAYENAQARERTQVLMDLANMYNGLVVGTGDLSELALGWATYNGDHMSMYAVNASVPKTLVRHLVKWTADDNRGKIKWILQDILDTPVSPELIPSDNQEIKQVTEDIVGPYVLHDFFLYNMIKRGFTPKKIYYAAINTFKGEFDREIILKWLKIFIRRFFNQQFKRSCMPDGVKVSEISLSPRAGIKLPSDAVSKLWLDELENLQ